MKDRYNREITYMRLSVTDRCNLRCRYCMPIDGICKKKHSDMLTEDEMIMAVKAASSLGVKKLRITGGEPLIKKNILSICRRSAEVENIEDLCLTTNGILLPDMAKDLYKSGVKRLNISLDTLNKEKYESITRLGKLDDVLRGIEAALNVGFDKIKINTVLIGGFNDDEIEDLANLSKEYPVDVRFIELMPLTKNEMIGDRAYIPCDYVLKALPKLKKAENDNTNSVAKLYQLENAKGNIGLISAVSKSFCGSCNRIRLTADGKLKPCLHSNDEFSIKGKTLNEMRQAMIKTIMSKPLCHAPLSSTQRSNAGRDMNLIGG